MRHWQPVRAIYKIASSTARKLVSRGRPNALRAGMEGSITAHSASVRSLAYRCPARSYFGRVISVHMLYLGDCSTQLLCYNHLKSLNSFPVSLLEPKRLLSRLRWLDMNALQLEHADLGRRAAGRGETTNPAAGRQDPVAGDDQRHRILCHS